MWQALSDEARRAVRELCAAHGSRLYDYCRTELGASGAEQAVAGTLLTAHLYADRLGDPALRRAWFYALARAHRAVAAEPASIGSWSRPGRVSELLPEALLSLDRPHRELLDLSVRHGLADSELALIFELRAQEVRAVVTRAARGLEGWFAAVIAARSGDGCPELAARVDAWLAAPGRRARARIGRHIPSCDACRTAPRTVSAGALLRRLPMAALPDTLVERLESAAPLPGEGPMWRADGFPAQARLLPEPAPTAFPAVPEPAVPPFPTVPELALPSFRAGSEHGVPPFPAASEPAVPPFPAVPDLAGAGAGSGVLSAPVAEELLDSPVADPTTATGETSWPAAGAAAAGQEPSALQRGRAGGTAHGRHPFTPPSRTRGVRGGSHGGAHGGAPGGGAYGDKLVYGAAANGKAIIRYGGITSAADRRPVPAGEREEPWRDRPPQDDEAGQPVRVVVRVALMAGVGLLVVGLVWSLAKAQEQQPVTRASAQAGALPDRPDRAAAQDGPAARAGAQQEGTLTPAGAQEEGTLTPVRKQAELPRPEPPAARLSPASLRLGTARTGSFTLSCGGACAIVSATGTGGVTVSGTTFRVKEVAPRPGCPPVPVRQSGKIVVRWKGTATGDGRRTAGTARASGTLTLPVSWTAFRCG